MFAIMKKHFVLAIYPENLEKVFGIIKKDKQFNKTGSLRKHKFS